MAKRVIRAAYGKSPQRSYIGGCSNGGRHTMVAASRYADQYDGYLVGAPGFNLPQAAVANIYGAQQYAPLAVPGAVIPGGPPFGGLPDLSGAFTLAERKLLSDKVLARCDALDGLADGLVQNIRLCQRRFDLDSDVPTCAGARDGTCLSAAQKQAIGNIFAGPKDSNGRPITDMGGRFIGAFPMTAATPAAARRAARLSGSSSRRWRSIPARSASSSRRRRPTRSASTGRRSR